MANQDQPAGQQADAATAPVHPQGAATEAATTLQNASAINSAQLIQSLHHSEMRVGIQSAEFGDISISTSINHQALSAQISMDHSELSKALALHLPAIEAKLGSAYGLEARVEVKDGGNSSPNHNQGKQAKERSPSQGVVAPLRTGAVPMSVFTGATNNSTAAGTSRLDIRI